jgi:hypothetical protein
MMCRPFGGLVCGCITCVEERAWELVVEALISWLCRG